MGAVSVIMLNTFREVIRQRMFLLVICLTAAALAIMLVVPFFTFREETQMYKDLSLSTAALTMVFLVALTASSTMAEEFDAKTAMTVLSKPVPRWQFLLGKYLGVVLALLAATLVLALLLFVAVYLRVYLDAMPRERRLAFTFSQSQPAQEFQAKMLGHGLAMFPGAAMIFYQGCVLAAVAVVLASRYSRVLAVVATFGLFLVGHLLEFVTIATRHSSDTVRSLAAWAVNLLPFLETFNITGRLSHTSLDPARPEFAQAWTYTGLAGLYAVAYAAFILILGTLLLRRREMT
ncbi:MAG: hypothetical protein GWP05_06340 [Anaerolineaceae bacterium]|nr:hypothetical protein [Anaerolineaceae bacterium]